MPKPLALILEGDRRLGDTLVDLLELLEMRCELIRDSKQARQQITHLKPDLVVIDLPFYKRTGLEILTDIRIDLRLRDTKVIVISTDQYTETAELDLADAVLIKPFSFNLLEETVYTLIELPSSDGGKFASFSSIHP